MKRVLLTGASGFIGRYCVPALVARGLEVHAVSRTPGRIADACSHAVDLFDADRVARLFAEIQPHYLLHLAWITEPGVYPSSIENLHWTEASLRLLRLFHEHGGQRVVVSGTCAEYDWQHGYCQEFVTPLKPATLYGNCKRSLQIALDAYARQTGLSAAWGRLFFLYGPHAPVAKLPAAVITALLENRPARCTHGNQIRDFLHVHDAAEALVALLTSEVQGPVNIASGQPIRIKDLVGRITDQLGRPDLVRWGGIEPPPGDPPLILADVRRLTEEVGWSPHYTLGQGLQDTIAWWREHHNRAA